MTDPIKNWDISLDYGEEGEAMCKQWALGFFKDNKDHEVKRKTRKDPWFYVEYEQNARNRGIWTPSGITISDANRWDFVIEDTGLIVSTWAWRLRQVFLEARRDTQRLKTTISDNPTKGVLIHFEELIRGEYDSRLQP